METPLLIYLNPRGFVSSLVAFWLMLSVPHSIAEVSAQTTPAPAAADSGTSAMVAPPQFIGNQIVLTPEQSIGGKIMKLPDGKMLGVSLDKSCEPNFKMRKDACIEWKLAAPLPSGWWHGVIKSNLRPGYSNRDIAIMLGSAQKPSVMVAPNFVNWNNDRPQIFEFWIYSSTPVESVCIKPHRDLWIFKNTWPISQITLEHRDPTALTAADAVTVDLPVQPDGSITLPPGMPPGNWFMKGVTKVAGMATIEGEDKSAVQTPLPFDRYKRPSTVFFFTDSPLRKITFTPGALLTPVLLEHNVTRSSGSLASADKLTTTVDASKTESGQLVMIGTNLTGEAPTFTLLPKGQKTAVLTSWDDGKPEDMRCAEILNRYGYHPTYFLNQDSPAMKFLDKLEALNGEIGSHCYHHPALYSIPPKSAIEECVEGRKVLEKALQHPVISFAYPNGYTPAYDAQGDYVLRAVKEAGYWSGRTTGGKAQTVDTCTDLATMGPDSFIGNAKELEKTWANTRTLDGGIFYFWGHSWQIGQTDEQWKKFDDFVAQFAKQPDTWYPSQGEFALWLWARKNIQIAVENKSPTKVVVKLSRPWLHPYLAAKCPLTFKVPAGVQKVVWQGKAIPVANGRVEIAWVD